jgi:hypothetical protein
MESPSVAWVRAVENLNRSPGPLANSHTFTYITGMVNDMPKTAALAFRIDAGMKAALEKAARDDSRSVSSLCDKIIAEWLRAHGYMAKAKSGRK